MGMLPTYIMQDVTNCIHTACWRQLKSMPRPTEDWKELARLYVHPDDHPICHRALHLYEKSVTSQVYRHHIETKTGWRSTVNVTVKAENQFFFPEIPTLDIDRESEFYRSLVEWVEWDEEISTRWVNVLGMVKAFDETDQPLSVLKELWPEFDLILGIKGGARQNNGTKTWVEKFRQLGKPRSSDMPVINTMMHLEEIRRTVLSVLMMPQEFELSEAKDAYVHMYRRQETITTPWGMKLVPITPNL
jgi:hypothetical protein